MKEIFIDFITDKLVIQTCIIGYFGVLVLLGIAKVAGILFSKIGNGDNSL